MTTSVARAATTTMTARPPRDRLRQPRDLDRPVPVPCRARPSQRTPERLRQLAAQPLDHQLALHGDPPRRVRDQELGELPALLLELPRDARARFRSADPVHQRGGDRLGQPHGPGLAAARRASPGYEQPTPSGDRRRRRIRRAEQKTKPLCGMGRHNHENIVAIPGYKRPVLLSGDDTFVSLPTAVAALHVHGEEPEGRLERQGRSARVRRRQRQRQQRLLRLPDRDPESIRASSSRSRSENDPSKIIATAACERKDVVSKRLRISAASGAGPPAAPAGSRARSCRCTGSTGRSGSSSTGATRSRTRTEPDAGLPVHPPRGHRVRQAAGHAEHRLPRDSGAGPATGAAPASDVDERAHLADGARQERPDVSALARALMVEGDDKATSAVNDGRSVRSGSRTTSTRRGTGQLLIRRIRARASNSSCRRRRGQDDGTGVAGHAAACDLTLLARRRTRKQVVACGRPGSPTRRPVTWTRRTSRASTSTGRAARTAVRPVSPGNWGAGSRRASIDVSAVFGRGLVPRHGPGPHVLGRLGARPTGPDRRRRRRARTSHTSGEGGQLTR